MDAPQEPTLRPDKITICVFFREEEIGSEALNSRIQKEIANIREIQARFNQVAGSQPPEISVSMLVVPDWENRSSYKDTTYQTKKAMVLGDLRGSFNETNIVVDDFCDDLSGLERAHLEELSEGSNCLDMMKIKSIISNADRKHLQLDSNTVITDYRGLYGTTFADEEQCDALNASFYGRHHVTPHSKMVYTHPAGKIHQELRERYNNYLLSNCQAQDRNNTEDFYRKVFSKGMKNIGLSIQDRTSDGRDFLYANLGRPEYRISRDMLTSVNKTHQQATQPLSKNERILSEIVPWRLDIPSRDLSINCDISFIKSLIKKYTADKAPETCHQQLIAISNEGLEQHILRDYLLKAPLKPEQKKTVVGLIPDNPYGNQLVSNLFGYGYTVSRLYSETGVTDFSRRSSARVAPVMSTLTATQGPLHITRSEAVRKQNNSGVQESEVEKDDSDTSLK